MLLFTPLVWASLAGNLLTGPGPLPAPPQVPALKTLKAARALGPGPAVTIRAVVLNGPELGALRFVQDADAGLALYSAPGRLAAFDELRAGDSLQVTGQLKNENGLLALDPITAVRKISSGRPLHAFKVPLKDVGSAFTEANEGRLLEITGVSHLTTPAGATAETLSADANFLLDGRKGAPVHIAATSTGPKGLAEAETPKGETFDVRGILSQASASGNEGYLLLPRLATDLVRSDVPRLTSEPVPVSITPQGFTIEFTTQFPGDTRVQYGLGPTQLTEQRTSEALTAQHRLVLDGLEAGTTYYVQVSSHNKAGTATSEAFPVITGGRNKNGRGRR